MNYEEYPPNRLISLPKRTKAVNTLYRKFCFCRIQNCCNISMTYIFFLNCQKYIGKISIHNSYHHKATCIWKFVQWRCFFIASKLNAGCGGYLYKIYKIFVDILDLKAGFPLAIFFIRSDFFGSKTMKTKIGSYFFYFGKSLTNENLAKSHLVRKKFGSGKPA